MASGIPLGSPTTTPQPTPGAVVSPPASVQPIDPDLLFANPGIDVSSGWRQLNVKKAAFEMDGGRLASTYEKKGSWTYAVRELATPETVVRVGGEFTSSGLGYFGWLCGDSSTGRYYGAVPETDGSLVFIDGGYTGVEPLERYEDLGGPISNGVTTVMGIECTIDHGTLWIQAFVGDGEPIAVHEEEVDDIAHFDVVGMYGEALEPGFTMAVDNVTALWAGGATGAVPFSALPVIDYAASAAPDGCQESTRTGDELVAVECYRQDEGAGPEFIQLAAHPSTASMNEAFSRDEAAVSCPDSAPTTWSRGAIRCVAQSVGIRLEWTDETLGLVGRLVDFQGDELTTNATLQGMLAAN